MPHPYKQFYRRTLPHIQPPNATFFVTFRLAGSVPKSVLEQWKQEKRWLEAETGRGSKTCGQQLVVVWLGDWISYQIVVGTHRQADSLSYF